MVATRAQVCRCPMQHSPDLQQLLWPGDLYVNFDILLYHYPFFPCSILGCTNTLSGLHELTMIFGKYQASKVLATCSTAPSLSQMFARVFPRSGLSDDPMGLLMQLVSPEPLDGRASL